MSPRSHAYASALTLAVSFAACSSSSDSASGPSGVGPGSTLADGGTATRDGNVLATSDAATSDFAPCATDKSAGTHSAVCEGFEVALTIPSTCPDAGCGLILDLHGALMTGDVEDAHTELRARAGSKGYVVVQPTGQTRSYLTATGPQFFNSDDDALHRVVLAVARDLAVDRKRIHATGFSQGGFATLRLMCKHADTFASIAPGAAGIDGCPLDESIVAGCSFAGTSKPSRPIDVLFMYGRKDAIVPKDCAEAAIAAITKGFALGAPMTIASDAAYARKRYTGESSVLETLEHDYEAGGALAFNDGHCVPGSEAATGSSWDDLACTGTNAFVWGAEVLAFFEAHPR